MLASVKTSANGSPSLSAKRARTPSKLVKGAAFLTIEWCWPARLCQDGRKCRFRLPEVSTADRVPETRTPKEKLHTQCVEEVGASPGFSSTYPVLLRGSQLKLVPFVRHAAGRGDRSA